MIRWKLVPGYSNYVISTHGAMKRVDGKKITIGLDHNGYPRVSLRKDGKSVVRTVHRLILETFIGPAPDGHEACHGDGVRTNNKLSNLRWDTRKNNIADALRHGTFQRGEKQGSAKLTDKKVIEIRKRYKNGERAVILAKEFEMSRSMIFYVVNRHNWKHV